MMAFSNLVTMLLAYQPIRLSLEELTNNKDAIKA
jgi:hypothetical protein